MATLNNIKNWFSTGLKPTQQQFSDTWDSFWHKDGEIPITTVQGLEGRFNDKADQSAFESHLKDDQAHKELFDTKQGKLSKGYGIEISEDNIISVNLQPSSMINYGDLQIFKASVNEAITVEAGDIVRGFISPNIFFTGKYNAGDAFDIGSYTILEQIDL